MPPPEPGPRPRFTRAERLAHRGTALLTGVLVVTGLVLYLPVLSLLLGRRPLFESVHVVAGLLLPFPALGAALTPEFRSDLGRLNRFSPHDWAWLSDSGRRYSRIPIGKFNAGQKLAAAAFGAAGVVLLATGLMLLAPGPLHLPVSLRQGATIVHDATTLALLALLAGHAWLAYQHPESRRALREGVMDEEYAQRAYPGWTRDETS